MLRSFSTPIARHVPVLTTIRHGTSIPIILLQELPGKGAPLQTISVKRGFARNFLVPRRIAVYATEENKAKYLNAGKPAEPVTTIRSIAAEAAANEAHRRALRAIPPLQFAKAVADADYGGVCVADISDMLQSAHQLKAKKVELPAPLKRLGDHKVRVDGVDVTVRVVGQEATANASA